MFCHRFVLDSIRPPIVPVRQHTHRLYIVVSIVPLGCAVYCRQPFTHNHRVLDRIYDDDDEDDEDDAPMTTPPK